jgi:hypothetical protein
MKTGKRVFWFDDGKRHVRAKNGFRITCAARVRNDVLVVLA